MAVNIGTAFASGLTQGAERYQQTQAEAPFRQERLKQAQAQTKLAEAQVAAIPQQQSEQEMRNRAMELQLRQAEGNSIKQGSFDAFRMYDADGDARHLNTFYTNAKRTKMGRNMFGNLARVDALTRTPDTERMLQQAGITDLDGFFSDPDLVKSMVLSTQADGKQVLTDMNEVYVGTGFTNHMTNEQLDTQIKQASLLRQMQTGSSYQNVTSRERVARQMAEDLDIPVWQAYQQLDKKTNSTSNLDRVAKQVMSENPGMSELEATETALGLLKSTEDERRAGGDPAELERIKERKARTTAQKNIEGTDDVRNDIRELRDSGYDSTDPAQRRQMGYLITDLQQITGRKLSTEDQRVARELRNLVSLGGTAGEEITDKETGPVDYLMKNFKKYVSDEVSGTAATTSYEQFRNIFRNALYGATLTDAEIKAFTRAAGSLSQQRGPVLAALKTQLTSVKNNIQSIYDMNDPDIAEYYLGMDLEQADRAIEALDERLSMMSGSTTTTISAQPGGERPSLDAIFGGEG